MTHIDRRAFLASSALYPWSLALPAWAQAVPNPPADGLIERLREPPNLEFPFHTLNSLIIPNDRYFVRCHFPVPAVAANAWRLRIQGAVRRELELTFEQLRAMQARTVTAVMECAGNSRALNVPPLRGVGWQQGAVGNAEWTGVPLLALLDRAEPTREAVDVVLEGADQGEVTAEPHPPGPLSYARSIPLAKARQPEVLLAHRMNGADLPAAHGFPVRAVVPGWYGMASVKWLTRIIVTDRPFQGFWQTSDYSYFERIGGVPTMRPVTEMQVKSLIARPRAGETVRAGAEVRIHGAAWTGESHVNRVDISTDGGATWAMARLAAEGERFTWRLWDYTWRAPANAGRVTLMSRATDALGRTQPTTRNTDRRTYMVNHILPVEVQVN